MNSNKDKEGSANIKAAVIGGVFVVLAAIITVVVPIINENRTKDVRSTPTSVLVVTDSLFQTPTQMSVNFTATSAPTAGVAIDNSTVKAEDVMPYVKGEPEGVKNVVTWWQEIEPNSEGGMITPFTLPNHQCYGLAWNTNEYGYRVLIVFQEPIAVTFRDGGWRTTICIPNNIIISPEDVGKIQADWLGKMYVDAGAQAWVVSVK